MRNTTLTCTHRPKLLTRIVRPYVSFYVCSFLHRTFRGPNREMPTVKQVARDRIPRERQLAQAQQEGEDQCLPIQPGQALSKVPLQVRVPRQLRQMHLLVDLALHHRRPDLQGPVHRGHKEVQVVQVVRGLQILLREEAARTSLRRRRLHHPSLWSHLRCPQTPSLTTPRTNHHRHHLLLPVRLWLPTTLPVEVRWGSKRPLDST